MHSPRIRAFQATTAVLVLVVMALVGLSAVRAPYTRPTRSATTPASQAEAAAPGVEVVQLGLHVRTLGPVDTVAQTFAASLDVWLIGNNLPDAGDLAFPDAVAPIRLGQPVAERATGDQRYRLYRTDGTFRYQPNTADLVSGRLRLGIDVIDGRATAEQRLIVPDTRGSAVLPDHAAGPAATADGAWTVEDASLTGRTVALPTLGDPAFPGALSRHAGVAAQFDLLQASLDGNQLIQRLLPSALAVPLLVGSVALLFCIPLLRRRDPDAGPWRMFTVLIALGLLLGSAEQVFAAFLAPGFGPAAVQAAMDAFAVAWLVLAATSLISLMPVAVWGPMERKTGTPPSALERTVVNVVIVLAVALFVLAKVLHLSATSIGAASGVLTIVLGIALQNIILDLFSGILLNLEKPFRLLNFVTINAGGAPVYGQVRNMNWRTTQIQTRDNDIVSIPNSVTARATVINHATPSNATRWKLEFVLDPKADTQLARQVMKAAVLRSAEQGLVLSQPPPNVVVREVEDYGVRYRVLFYLNLNITPELAAQNNVAENVLEALAKAGIKLAFRNHGFIVAPDQAAPEIAEALAAEPTSAPQPAAGAGAILGAEEIARVRTSWNLARPLGDAVAVLFYNRLFEIAPPLRALFRSDQAMQRSKLLAMLAMLVKGLDQPDHVMDALTDLGLKHGGYGVKTADYDAVGAALLWTLEKGLGDAFDAPTRDAWTKLYGAIAGVMIAASGEAVT